jgi:ATP-dependent Clp protease ATP-binding subunit ClpC
MTSNIGSRDLISYGKGVGFDSGAKKSGMETAKKSIIDKALRKTFAPEFLNRVDDIIMFEHLNKEAIHKIIEIELKGLYSRIAELGYNIKISTAAKDFITDKGYDPKYGARPLKRAIQKYLENKMAETIIKAEISEGDTINIGYSKKQDEITVKITKKQ